MKNYKIVENNEGKLIIKPSIGLFMVGVIGASFLRIRSKDKWLIDEVINIGRKEGYEKTSLEYEKIILNQKEAFINKKSIYEKDVQIYKEEIEDYERRIDKVALGVLCLTESLKGGILGGFLDEILGKRIPFNKPSSSLEKIREEGRVQGSTEAAIKTNRNFLKTGRSF